MGLPELRILKATIEYVCPWCKKCELTVHLGEKWLPCPGCGAKVSVYNLLVALVSTFGK
jgi:Zn finger protein HypA/HybF involved in hydrogenase expression